MTLRFIKIISIIAAAAIVSLLYFYYPAGQSSFYPGCALYSLSGFHCPACGSQRSFSLLLHGDLTGALRNNALFILALFTGIIIFVKYVFIYFTKRRILQIKASPRQLWIFLFVVLLFWIFRNLPFYPFQILAPVSVD